MLASQLTASIAFLYGTRHTVQRYSKVLMICKRNSPRLPQSRRIKTCRWLPMRSMRSQLRMFGGNAIPAAMNGKPSSKHGSKAVCVLFVLREPFCKVIMTLGQLILTCSQNGTMKRTPSGHRAMHRETRWRSFAGNAEQDTLTAPKSQIELLSKRVALNVKQSFNRLSRRCW